MHATRFVASAIILLCVYACDTSTAPHSDQAVVNDTPHKVLKMNLDKLSVSGKSPEVMSIVDENFAEIKTNEKELYNKIEPAVKKLESAKTADELKPIVEELKAQL
jgi:hypothetical protein